MNQTALQSYSWIIGVIVYIVFAFPLYTMAQKTSSDHPWFAFIPILNAWLAVEISGKDWWWFILIFVPCIGIIAAVVIWMGIAERMNKPSWWGILILVPFVDIIVPFYLAYG